ncbi:hypothetical protein [Magnetofaba australis]|nr:hypothetical protein [Magnetofaba australis]
MSNWLTSLSDHFSFENPFDTWGVGNEEKSNQWDWENRREAERRWQWDSDNGAAMNGPDDYMGQVIAERMESDPMAAPGYRAPDDEPDPYLVEPMANRLARNTINQAVSYLGQPRARAPFSVSDVVNPENREKYIDLRRDDLMANENRYGTTPHDRMSAGSKAREEWFTGNWHTPTLNDLAQRQTQWAQQDAHNRSLISNTFGLDEETGAPWDPSMIPSNLHDQGTAPPMAGTEALDRMGGFLQQVGASTFTPGLHPAAAKTQLETGGYHVPDYDSIVRPGAIQPGMAQGFPGAQSNLGVSPHQAHKPPLPFASVTGQSQSPHAMTALGHMNPNDPQGRDFRQTMEYYPERDYAKPETMDYRIGRDDVNNRIAYASDSEAGGGMGAGGGFGGSDRRDQGGGAAIGGETGLSGGGVGYEQPGMMPGVGGYGALEQDFDSEWAPVVRSGRSAPNVNITPERLGINAAPNSQMRDPGLNLQGAVRGGFEVNGGRPAGVAPSGLTITPTNNLMPQATAQDSLSIIGLEGRQASPSAGSGLRMNPDGAVTMGFEQPDTGGVNGYANAPGRLPTIPNQMAKPTPLTPGLASPAWPQAQPSTPLLNTPQPQAGPISAYGPRTQLPDAPMPGNPLAGNPNGKPPLPFASVTQPRAVPQPQAVPQSPVTPAQETADPLYGSPWQLQRPNGTNKVELNNFHQLQQRQAQGQGPVRATPTPKRTPQTVVPQAPLTPEQERIERGNRWHEEKRKEILDHPGEREPYFFSRLNGQAQFNWIDDNGKEYVVLEQQDDKSWKNPFTNETFKDDDSARAYMDDLKNEAEWSRIRGGAVDAALSAISLGGSKAAILAKEPAKRLAGAMQSLAADSASAARTHASGGSPMEVADQIAPSVIGNLQHHGAPQAGLIWSTKNAVRSMFFPPSNRKIPERAIVNKNAR